MTLGDSIISIGSDHEASSWASPQDSSLGRFTQADSIIPAGVQGLDRYAYVSNNSLRYTDPSGHRACEDDSCEHNLNQKTYTKEETLTYKLEKNYNINIEGSWNIDELNILANALDAAAYHAGGISNLNDVFHDALENRGSSADQITFFNGTKDQGTAECGKGFAPTSNACWNWKTGTIVMSDFHFSKAYQQNRQIPGINLANNLDLYFQKTILHEMSHVFTDARPISSWIYQSYVENETAYGRSAYESMANASAYYILTGGGNSAMSPEQMNWANLVQGLWRSTP